MAATEANAINAATTGIVGNTGTAFTGTAVTQYNILVGGSTSSTLSNVAPSATSGVPLISQGASSNPAFGTAVVAGGGTGDTSFTAYAPVCGGTTSTSALQSASTGQGTSGFVLTSTGASSLPTFQTVSAAGAITQIDTDSGNITPTSGVVTISGGTTGLTTSGATSTVDLTGTLKLANGGTNASLTASNGGIFYSTATAGAILAGTATAHQVLLSGASTTPLWSTSTYPTTNAINTLLYASAANTMAALATADSGALFTTSAGVPYIDTTNIAVLSTGLQLKGNNTNTTPPAGFIGEQMRSGIGSVPLSNGTPNGLVDVSLTAGIWDISGTGLFVFSGVGTGASWASYMCISATSASFSGSDVAAGDNYLFISTSGTGGQVAPISIPTWRVTLSTTTNYFLNVQAAFSNGTCSVDGRISATRVG